MSKMTTITVSAQKKKRCSFPYPPFLTSRYTSYTMRTVFARATSTLITRQKMLHDRPRKQARSRSSRERGSLACALQLGSDDGSSRGDSENGGSACSSISRRPSIPSSTRVCEATQTPKCGSQPGAIIGTASQVQSSTSECAEGVVHIVLLKCGASADTTT